MPRLAGGGDPDDDLELSAGETAALLGRPVLVEEKLDGANVALWVQEGAVTVSLRSGIGSLDRGGQLGPLRAWSAERADRLRRLLGSGEVLYAEWLFWTHSVRYDALPSYLVGVDLWRPGRGFLPPDERAARLREEGFALPPELRRGVVGDLGRLVRLEGRSRYGPEPMEGMVVRSLDGAEPRIAKHLRAGFRRLDDEAWRRGRPRNGLAAPVGG